MPTGSIILVADDDAAIRTVLSQALSRAGYEVRTTGNVAPDSGERSRAAKAISSSPMSSCPTIQRLRTAAAHQADAAGAADHRHERAKHVHDRDQGVRARRVRVSAQTVRSEGTCRHRRARARAAAQARARAATTRRAENMPLVGRSPAMQDIFRSLARLMQTDLTVMIAGESGTGKELVARALHDYGKRRTGSVRRHQHGRDPARSHRERIVRPREGRLHRAPTRARSAASSRPRAARCSSTRSATCRWRRRRACCACLQQGEYTTVGGRTPIKTNVRIVAATNKDLRTAIASGQFREDLFFRLNVVPLRLPPLRERSEDIADLVRHFFQRNVAEGLSLKSLESSAHRPAQALFLARQHPRTGEPRRAASPRFIRKRSLPSRSSSRS